MLRSVLLMLSIGCATPAPPPPGSDTPAAPGEAAATAVQRAAAAPASPAALPSPDVSAAGTFHPLADGLELAVFSSPTPSSHGDGRIRVVRVDPRRHQLVLRAATAGHGAAATAMEWSRREGFVAAINPGMFRPDGSTTGLLQIDGTVVTERISADKDLLAFDPVAPSQPSVHLIDRGCDDLDAIRPRYRSLVQGIRMLSCTGRNVWTPGQKKWSHAVFGVDSAGRILLVHARSPWNTHDFIEILRALPLDLVRIQYAEGGPEATLAVRTATHEAEWFGSYETGFWENDDNDRAWPLPNILGVRLKPAP